MIIVPDRYTFVATPRTASRAIVEALLRRYPKSITSYPKDHHIDPEYVPKDYPIYTVIREPLSHIMSWWYHVDYRNKVDRNPLQFAQQYRHPVYIDQYRKYKLNPYAEIADRFFVYETELPILETTFDIQLETVGKGTYPKKPFAVLREYIEDEFADDVQLYKSLSGT
jgi:hypothetical protein